MHTISMLRRTLGLSSDNQVRNRIERIKDLLTEHIRRGPNNQIFLTDPGLELMRQLQELYDTGLTLAEASQVLRATAYSKGFTPSSPSSASAPNRAKPSASAADLISDVQHELSLLRKHMAALEKHLPSSLDNEALSADAAPWWSYLREDIDAT